MCYVYVIAVFVVVLGCFVVLQLWFLVGVQVYCPCIPQPNNYRENDLILCIYAGGAHDGKRVNRLYIYLCSIYTIVKCLFISTSGDLEKFL